MLVGIYPAYEGRESVLTTFRAIMGKKKEVEGGSEVVEGVGSVNSGSEGAAPEKKGEDG